MTPDTRPLSSNSLVAYLHLLNAPQDQVEKRPGRYLAERLGTTPMTASRVLTELCARGLAVRHGGRGIAALSPEGPVDGLRIVRATIGPLPSPGQKRGDGICRPWVVTICHSSPQAKKESNIGNTTGVTPNEMAYASGCYFHTRTALNVLTHYIYKQVTNEKVTSSEEAKKERIIQKANEFLARGEKRRGRPPSRKALILAMLYIKRRKIVYWDYNPTPESLLPVMLKAVRRLEAAGEGPRQWGSYLDWLFTFVGKWTRGQLVVPPASWVASETRIDAWVSRPDRPRLLDSRVVDRLVVDFWPDPKERYNAVRVLIHTLHRDLGIGAPGVFHDQPYIDAYRIVWEHRQEVIDGAR